MFEQNVLLSGHSNYKIGGPAKYFFTAKTIEELQAATKEATARKLPIFILGGGTNLLISDAGYSGLVLKAGFSPLEYNDKENYLVRVGAGVSVADLLQFTINESLSGLEWAGGLPGTVGGAIWGNAGAFGGEIKDSLVEVESFDLNSGNIIHRSNAECKFFYRSSVFKERAGREVIIEATFRLKKGDKAQIKQAINEKIEYRQNRQPLEYPNIGSIFKNIRWENVPKDVRARFEHKFKTDPIPVLPTAVLIDAAGLKGTTIGGARVSEKHPNFIINHAGATAEDVKKLMEIVKTELKKQFNVDLEQEVIFV